MVHRITAEPGHERSYSGRRSDNIVLLVDRGSSVLDACRASSVILRKSLFAILES